MKITANEEQRFIKDAFLNQNLSEEDAEIAAASLTLANLRGIDSHGIIRLPLYIKRLQKKIVSARTQFKIEKEGESFAIVDACNSLGQIVARKGMELAVEKAKKHTISIVSVKNSNHFGAAAEYSMLAAKQGCIGIAVSNTIPLMPPTGAKEKMLGNNPISIAIPDGKGDCIAVDMAMSTVALGKVIVADNNNKAIPIGWGVDKDGRDTTDPKDVLNGGFLLPVGGPKGYGLALAIEVLTGVITNSAVSRELNPLANFEAPQKMSHTFIAIHLEHLIDPESYQERLSTLIRYIRSCQLVEGVEKIYLPGELEAICNDKRMNEGIPVGDKLIVELDELASDLGIAPIARQNN